MHRFPTTEALRHILAVSAACAITACGAGTQQQVTPAANTGVAQQSAARLTTASRSDRNDDDNRDVESGDDGNGAVVYSSIPKPLKAVASVGFEANQELEFGDGVKLTRTGKLQQVRYVLSSWGCQSGHWYSNDCVTTPGATFPVPITINVHAVDNSVNRVGTLLATQTRTFNVPYRPSADHVRCTGTQAGKFYSTVDARCVNGLANVITYSFSGPRVTLPLQSTFSLAYSTTHYGTPPRGESAPCFMSSGGCGYDSLNVSADGPGGPIGSPVDPNSVFDSYAPPFVANYCNPALGYGFRIDSGCPPGPAGWTLNHPQFEVRVGGGGGGEGRDD
jgi:hypothetical protein